MPLQRVLDRGISIAKSPGTTLALPVDAPHRRKRHLLRAEDPVRTPRTPGRGTPVTGIMPKLFRALPRSTRREPRARGVVPASDWQDRKLSAGALAQKEPQSIWAPCGFGTEIAISRDAGSPARKGRLSAQLRPVIDWRVSGGSAPKPAVLGSGQLVTAALNPLGRRAPKKAVWTNDQCREQQQV